MNLADVGGPVHEESDKEGAGAQQQEQEKEDVIDPENPLYGLEQRLKHINLDEVSKQMIKSRLVET